MITADGIAQFTPESDVRTAQESAIVAELQRFWVEVWQMGNMEYIPHLVFPNTVVDGNVGNYHGIEGYNTYVEMFRSGLSEIRVSFERTLTQGGQVSMTWHLMGIHSGELFGQAATNKPVSLTSNSHIMFFNNQIGQELDTWDIFGLATQLSAMPKDLQAKIDGDDVIGQVVPGSTEPDESTKDLTAEPAEATEAEAPAEA